MKKCFLKTTLLAAVLCAVGGGYGSAALYGISIEKDGAHAVTSIMQSEYDNTKNDGNSFLVSGVNVVTGSINKIGEKTSEGNFYTNDNSVYGYKNKVVPHNQSGYSQVFGSRNNVGSSSSTVIGDNNNVAYKNYATMTTSTGGYTYNTVLGNSNTVNGGSYGVAVGYNNSVSADYGVAIGATASASGKMSVAIGYGAKTSADSDAVKVADETWMTTVSFGDNNTSTSGKSYFARLKNVYEGVDDYDAVNVKQLKEYVEEHSGTTYTAGDHVEISADNKISVKADGKVEAGNDSIVTGGKVYEKTGDTSKLAKAGLSDNLTDSILDVNEKVDNVNNQVVDVVNNSLGTIRNDINKVGAGAAALAALHPETFNPDDKWSFAVGYGHYKNANAGALGTFYKPNADTTVSLGSTIGNGDAMMNLGVSFKLGHRGENFAPNASNAELAAEVNRLRNENAQMKADNEQIRNENAQMKAQIAQIMKKLALSDTVQKTAPVH